MEQKTKILLWGDYCCATGFATVLGNIARELHKTGRYDIDVLAINYSGDPYDKEKWPGSVYPAMPGIMSSGGPYADVYGRQRLLDLTGKGIYDVVFLLQDTFILQTMLETLKQTQTELVKMSGAKTFKIVYYFPIDAQAKPDWATDVVAKVDFPVAYTKFGRSEVAKYVPALANIPYIYHGTNVEDFFYIESRESVKKFRHDFWHGLADDRFLIVNVNRNQPRKDIIRSLMILKELKESGRNPFMYLHMQHMDIGGNIFVMAEELGLENEVDFILPHPNVFGANQGISVDKLNFIYNAADAILTTTLGEGWGLSVTEAFATKTPVIGPDNTSLSEIMADNRGILVQSGNNPSMFKMDLSDNERLRPIMDVEDAVGKIEQLMDSINNKFGSISDVEGAYEWAHNNTWEIICRLWITLIDAAAEIAKQQNAIPSGMNRAERRAIERKQTKAKNNAHL